jgi:dihydrofolate synthase/folylpolyglutamate synthase
LAAIAQNVGFSDAASVDSVSEALRDFADRAMGARVLICGSLYLAGRVLSENRCPPPIS